MTRRWKSERGVALLAVILGIALMTLIVMDFTTTAALGYLSAANQANELRAYYLARSAVNVGFGLLAQDSRKKSIAETPSESFADIWAIPYPPLNVDGGQATVSVVDEARKIDINRLVEPTNGTVHEDVAGQLARLFLIVGAPSDLLPALVDWMDPDNIESPGGAEMDFYMRLRPPYAPRNGPMPTIGDLRMVRGVDDMLFRRLRQFLTVAPEDHINANTAPPEVLAALVPELMNDPKLIKEIIAARSIRPFQQVTDVGNLPDIGTLGTKLNGLLTTRSNYFTISGMGNFSGARKLVIATVHRAPNGALMLASWQEQ